MTTSSKTNKKIKEKKQHTRWLLTHKYPNGFCRAGIVKNTKLADPKIDVIAFEWAHDNEFETFHRIEHMTLEEAIAQSNCLIYAVSGWLRAKEHSNSILNKNDK